MNRFILILLIFCSSCSTLRKTIIYSSLSGALTGATAGAVLSPDKKSQGANAAVFGLIGAGVAALTGLALYNDDPRNYKLKHMLRDKELDPIHKDPNSLRLPLGDIKIDANLEKKEMHQVPVTKLPNKLKGKVNQQYLIKYQSKERYVKKGNKTFYIPSFEVFEHSYDNLIQKREGEKDEQ